MIEFFAAYDIFGHGNFGHEDFFVIYAESKELAYSEVDTIACDEYVGYAGLHGIGFDESTREELQEEGLSEEEIDEKEWEEAQDNVAVTVYTREELFNWLQKDGYTVSEIEKIVLDLQGKS